MRRLLSQFQRRPRLVGALALGLVVGAFAPNQWVTDEPFRRFLVGWNTAVWIYLLLIGWLILRANHARTRAISEREDPGAVLVLTILSLITVTSLAAIGFELAAVRGSADPVARYVFAGFTLLGSWTMLNVLFGFHYAHLYFRNAREPRPLRFPDEPPPSPDFWDFLYFSFTIAVAAQTADVAIVSGEMRRTVLAHSILAFLFNVAILGATINVVAGLVSGGA
ncbi:MAG TPA: DUF1345 domain-containing protein [Burkholderiaceae bacterium]|nr:DUF1345 domain-containing protein [Burkholderiaceae bacterium]